MKTEPALALLWVGWFRRSGRGKWKALAPTATEEEARQQARKAGRALDEKSFDTLVLPEGQDANQKTKKVRQ